MRKRAIIALFMGVALLISLQSAYATPLTNGATVVNRVNQMPVRTITVPNVALEKSPAIVPLGIAIDNGKLVEGYAIIHYKQDNAMRGSGYGSQGQKAVSPRRSGYKFLAKGARWKITEPYVIDPTNIDGMTSDFVKNTVATSMETWDTEVAFDVFGPEDTASTVDGADTFFTDGKNEIMFGDIAVSGAIGVTYVWGIFGGPIGQRQLVEYDMVLDDVDFNYENAGPTNETALGDITLMDLQNIATHELGHAAGLADLYESVNSEQTMYGYAANGETKKRTLNTGDLAGIKALYR